MSTRPIFLFDLGHYTPRDVALRTVPSYLPNREKEVQELTFYLEISRAEKRYAARLLLSKRYGGAA